MYLRRRKTHHKSKPDDVAVVRKQIIDDAAAVACFTTIGLVWVVVLFASNWFRNRGPQH